MSNFPGTFVVIYNKQTAKSVGARNKYSYSSNRVSSNKSDWRIDLFKAVNKYAGETLKGELASNCTRTRIKKLVESIRAFYHYAYKKFMYKETGIRSAKRVKGVSFFLIKKYFLSSQGYI